MFNFVIGDHNVNVFLFMWFLVFMWFSDSYLYLSFRLANVGSLTIIAI